MAIRTIRVENDEILRKVSKPVKEMTPRTAQLIDDLIENLHEYEGVGLAAVQIGVLKRICVICIREEDIYPPEDSEDFDPEREERRKDLPAPDHTDGKDIVIINPTVTVLEPDVTQTGSEGCLSFPGKYGTVTRPFHVRLNALDRDMQPFELEAAGLFARAICHECDHMDGVLYVDKVEGGVHRADEEDEEE